MNTHDWLESVRRTLDEGAESIDSATASKLNRARQHALDAGLRRAPLRWWWAGIALTTAACAMWALSLSLYTPEMNAPLIPVATEAPDQDFEMLAGTEDLELIENLEFYAWLEQQSLDG